MTLKALMASDVNDVFLNTDEHATTINYYDASAATTLSSIKGVVNPVELVDESNYDDGRQQRKVVMVFIEEHASRGVENPELGDIVTVNESGHPLTGQAFQVVACESDGFGGHYLRCQRFDAVEKSPGRNYRIER